MALLWVILKRYTILEDFFLLDSVRYRDDVMTTLKFDWSNLKILVSGWYRKLTSSCVSFTIYQQCHTDIDGDVTPISLQYQNVHWVGIWVIEICSFILIYPIFFQIYVYDCHLNYLAKIFIKQFVIFKLLSYCFVASNHLI